MPIQILPARLANQIAAGEVVERPASVIKELIENSIDAGSSDIAVEVEKGGHKRILIRDNGKGIGKDELGLALSRHATSKIQDIDDLEAITSLGFRGEALASISSVSRLVLTSKPELQEQAWQAHSEGRDMQIQLNPSAHPKGSSVEVLDLFFNTPARRKFLKAEKTEFQHIEEVFKRIALSHPQIAFTLKHNGKIIHRLAKTDKSLIRRRIVQICGQAFIDNSVEVLGQHQDMHISGFCSAIGHGRKTNDMQYTFINGRMIKDRVVIHAIRQAFEGMIDSQLYPAFVIFVTMPPDQLDINVHPAKHEVRFHQSRLVHDLLYRCINDALLRSAQLIQEEPLQGSDEPHQILSPKAQDPFAQPLNHSYLPSDCEQGEQSKAFTDKNADGADYIAPLSRTSNPTPSMQSSQYQSPTKSSTSGYSAALSKAMQNRPSNGELSAYRQVLSSESNTAKSGVVTSTAESLRQWILTADKRVLITHDDSLLLLNIEDLCAVYLSKEIANSSVQQPLLMPVSVESDVPPSTFSMVDQEVTQNGKKLILKKVPSMLRTLPWLAIFPRFVDLVSEQASDALDADSLLNHLALVWCQTANFNTNDIHQWLMQIGQQEMVNLIEARGTSITLPDRDSGH